MSDAEIKDLFDPRALTGDGNTEMVLFPHTGKVIIRFREPRLWVACEPSDAVQIGKKMIDCAVECGAKVEIKVPRRPISDRKRASLIVRATHVFRSMTEKGKAPKDIAQHVVDSILSAVD